MMDRWTPNTALSAGIATRTADWASPSRSPGGISEIGEILADPQALSWCDIVDPDHATLLELAQEVGLDPLAIEDAVAAAERAKATRHRICLPHRVHRHLREGLVLGFQP